MEDSYSQKVQQLENMCLLYTQKAQEEFMMNAGHTKQECVYLQKAAAERAKIASISTGNEKIYQQRELAKLNAQIAAAVRDIDPEYMRKLEEKKARERAKKEMENSGGNNNDAGSGTGEEPNEDEIDEEDVKKWFKEMPKHSFDDVSGMVELKQRLKECIADSHLQKIKDYLGIKKLHSYFFIGPPGCGKTYIIEAFAHELAGQHYKFLSLTGSNILSKYVGDAEKIVNRLFEEAEKNAPCLLFIDEIDGICKNRSLPNLPEYAASITTAFLTGYNRIHSSDKSIIFIGATNYPDQVDNAMMDRVELVRVPFPDEEARARAFEKEFEGKIALDFDITYEDMAAATDTYNYRDIQRLVGKLKMMTLKAVLKAYNNEDEAIEALQDGKYVIDRDLFDQAINECLPTPKDAIIKALDEWEEKFKKNEEEW